MPTLSQYAFQFDDTGFQLNNDGQGLPFVDVTGVSGIDTAPLRITTDEHQGTDGTYIDSPYMSSRTIVVTGTLYTDPNDPDSLLLQLRRDYNRADVRPFYFQLPGQPVRYINGQGGGCQYDIDTNRRIGSTPIQLTVLAGDPYIYDYPAQSSSCNLNLSSHVGMGFNAFFNMGFGGAIPGTTMTVTNSGTHRAYPIITINGPATNPVLLDSSSGITMAFAITLGTQDQLVINCQNKSVILNGTQSRRNTLAGLNWFSVPNGAQETVQFSADAGTGNATLKLNSTYF
jgi:hypothetical protein